MMYKYIFLRLHNSVSSNDDYFKQKTNCASAHAKTVAMHMLSLGTPAKAQEKYCRMTPGTARKFMLRWCRGLGGVLNMNTCANPLMRTL